MTNLRFQLKAVRTFFRPRYDFIFVSFRFLRCFCLSLQQQQQQHHQLLLLSFVAAAAAAVAIVFSTEIAPFGRRNPPHCRTLSRSSCPVSRAHPPTFSPFCSILAGLKSRVVPFPLNCVIMQKALCLHLHRSIVARHRMHPYVTDVRGGGRFEEARSMAKLNSVSLIKLHNLLPVVGIIDFSATFQSDRETDRETEKERQLRRQQPPLTVCSEYWSQRDRQTDRVAHQPHPYPHRSTARVPPLDCPVKSGVCMLKLSV